MTIDKYIAFFEAQPEERWCVGHYVDAQGRHCASGLLGARDDHMPDAVDQLDEMIQRHLCETIPDINDGLSFRYKQPTPKARILAALRDIKAKESAGHE